ncbi:MAG: DEAD/DEAH box helicase [Acidobacteria bacterium]|nr:DEAD/DEAH box helicase [Acidobacteriota bacterium]
MDFLYMEVFMGNARDPQKKLPSPHNWRTTDDDEIYRRRYRAQTESLRVKNLDPRFPIFSNFAVKSPSGLTYSVEIRSVSRRRFSCNCVDFRINGLGTCKHVEATLLYLETRYRRLYRQAESNGAQRLDVVPDMASGLLRIEALDRKLPPALARVVDSGGSVRVEDPEEALALLGRTRIPSLRISQEVGPWLETRRREQDRRHALREYEQKVQSGQWPAQETLVPLYPYQREGMRHLAFKERALLADEMGLGKTIQAIAASALLHRLGKAARVLVVTPASLKTEWEEQIRRFTDLPYQLIYGPRGKRLRLYASAPFFTIVNYEQMLADALDVNRHLVPDIVILDEAQRIKNWNTKTAQAVKRLQSRYAFVLTGTPVENRIDDIHSLMSFLDPSALGPLFRFNREFYELDERGRPSGYRRLEQLHERIKPFLLRRRKADVEAELPERTDQRYFVPLGRKQADSYAAHEAQVARLVAIAKSRPLTQQESEKLQRELAMMRMICDTNYILDPEDRTCPKLSELEKILEECRGNGDVKVIVFSEWARMLDLVKELCEKMGIGYALHTGSVPQRRRRAEIQLFKNDPGCRVFLSTDSGSTGLNLQNASVVVNCDLPWNPARLEQRIARAWRKHQTRPVTVIHLVSENTIEQRMLETLSSKQALADGILDMRGNLGSIEFRGGKQAFLSRLNQLVSPAPKLAEAVARKKALPVDRGLGFSEIARKLLGSACVRCEERYPAEGPHSVIMVVVDRDAPLHREKLAAPFEEFFGKGVSDPLAPVTLEVIDRSTDEAMGRLVAAGLISPSTRAVRELGVSGGESSSMLTEEELRKAREHRRQAGRKLKMAALLGGGGLLEEEREALLQAGLWLGKALSVENRLSEPSSLEETLSAPHAICWGEHFPSIRDYASDPSAAASQATTALRALIGE